MSESYKNKPARQLWASYFSGCRPEFDENLIKSIEVINEELKKGGYEVDDELSLTSTNPVQNKVLTANNLNAAVNGSNTLVLWTGLPTV